MQPRHFHRDCWHDELHAVRGRDVSVVEWTEWLHRLPSGPLLYCRLGSADRLSRQHLSLCWRRHRTE